MTTQPTTTKTTFNYDELVEILNQFDIVLARKPKTKQITINDNICFKFNDANIIYRNKLKLVIEKGKDKTYYTMDKLYKLPQAEIEENDKRRKQYMEQDRLNREEEFRQKLAKEDCTLTDKYINHTVAVHYLYKGYDYKVLPKCWNQGARPHLAKCIHYTQKHVEQLFADEECELLSEYQNERSWLSYKYRDNVYKVQFNQWRYMKTRPHLKA